MTKQMTLPEIVEHLGEIMPDHIEGDHLAAFILSILHGYFEPQDVIVFLRGLAEICEVQADKIEEFTGVADKP